MDVPPLASGVIYEFHVGTFTAEGTFDSTIERLDYLKQLCLAHAKFDACGGVSRRSWMGIR